MTFSLESKGPISKVQNVYWMSLTCLDIFAWPQRVAKLYPAMSTQT
jgi:hypothetical protein